MNIAKNAKKNEQETICQKKKKISNRTKKRRKPTTNDDNNTSRSFVESKFYIQILFLKKNRGLSKIKMMDRVVFPLGLYSLEHDVRNHPLSNQLELAIKKETNQKDN